MNNCISSSFSTIHSSFLFFKTDLIHIFLYIYYSKFVFHHDSWLFFFPLTFLLQLCDYVLNYQSKFLVCENLQANKSITHLSKGNFWNCWKETSVLFRLSAQCLDIKQKPRNVLFSTKIQTTFGFKCNPTDVSPSRCFGRSNLKCVLRDSSNNEEVRSGLVRRRSSAPQYDINIRDWWLIMWTKCLHCVRDALLKYRTVVNERQKGVTPLPRLLLYNHRVPHLKTICSFSFTKWPMQTIAGTLLILTDVLTHAGFGRAPSSTPKLQVKQ